MANDNVRAGSTSTALPLFAARNTSYSGDSDVKAPVVGLVTFDGADDAKSTTDIGVDNPLPVSDAKLDTIIELLGGAGAPPQVWKSFSVDSQETGDVLWTPGSGNKIVVTSVQLGSKGSTPAAVVLWYGPSGGAHTAYAEGSDQPVFKATFTPTALSTPGAVMALPTPIICAHADYVLRLTTSDDLELEGVIYGYEIAPA